MRSGRLSRSSVTTFWLDGLIETQLLLVWLAWGLGPPFRLRESGARKEGRREGEYNTLFALDLSSFSPNILFLSLINLPHNPACLYNSLFGLA